MEALLARRIRFSGGSGGCGCPAPVPGRRFAAAACSNFLTEGPVGGREERPTARLRRSVPAQTRCRVRCLHDCIF
eukprot:14038902-Alexandrium_andersonii.AAC.1